MAELVLGLASSHSPQLSTPADGWASRGERDKGHVELIGTDGITSNYEGLLARIDTERIAKELTQAKFEQRHQQNQQAIAHLSRKLYDARLDVLVMVGDDQHEYLLDDNMPAFCVYWGDEVKISGHEAGPSTGNQPLIGYSADDRIAPTDSALARHVIDSLMDDEFDVGVSNFLDPSKGGRAKGGIGHAFGYVYSRLMTEATIPTVPVMLNTYYPPNQPTPKRCYNLGQALKSAIESWPRDIRVGILVSGGLSHFVVDEELDQQALAGMKAKSVDQLSALPREKINSGSSEIRNWIVVTGATEHLDMDIVDYVPCYRSPAGTGCAMGFATWE